MKISYSIRDSIMCLMFCVGKETSTEQLQWCSVYFGEVFGD